ncbi:MAG: dethiobiotin synthase [Deltaproteobacteria bacterium]|nr:dethiobiotin synthase [Deltaproteobacteria bacterium]
MGKGLFITGTDTGVGKTLVSVGLITLFKERGIRVGVMKPAESGCRREEGRLIPEDAIMLKNAAESQDDLDMINPYALKAPLAPALAAEMEGVEIRLEIIQKAFEILTSRHDMIIVEGAGGFLVPLFGNFFMADLIKKLDLPLLLVTEAKLGIINHTLLTLACARERKIPVLGIVMNHASDQQGLPETLNPEALRRWAHAPFLGSIPFMPGFDNEAIKRAIQANLDLGPLEDFLKRG